jgi:hypothetical protein
VQNRQPGILNCTRIHANLRGGEVIDIFFLLLVAVDEHPHTIDSFPLHDHSDNTHASHQLVIVAGRWHSLSHRRPWHRDPFFRWYPQQLAITFLDFFF